MATETEASMPGRLRSLDGLRGLAAVLVVTFHAMIVRPALADVVRDSRHTDGWLGVLCYTPVRLLWAGEEAVMIFFVLSGFVLTLPFLSRPFVAVAYYPRRVLRIYVPVWGSIALALLWAVVVPRTFVSGVSWWTNGHASAVTLRGLGGDATLVIGTTWLNSVLWSLKWEMWFSLLLPLYLLVFVRLRHGPLLKLMALLAAVQVGVWAHFDPLRYLPIFGVGVLLAAEWAWVVRCIKVMGRWGWVGLVFGLLLLSQVRWWTGSFLSAGSVIGAALVVAYFAGWRPAIALSLWPPVQWVGRVSFSLYLVHEPIITSAAIALRTTNPVAVLALALPVTLLMAASFYRFVEVPAHDLAKRVGRRLELWIPLRRVRD